MLSMNIDIAADCAKLQEEWSTKNNMQLHKDTFELLSHKCRDDAIKELPFGNENCHYDTANGVTIYPTDSTRDLAVIISSDLSWEKQIHASVARAKSMSDCIFNVFKSRDPVTMLIAHPIQESNKKYIRVLLPDMAPRPTWYYSPNTDHRDTSALVHSKDRCLQRS